MLSFKIHDMTVEYDATERQETYLNSNIKEQQDDVLSVSAGPKLRICAIMLITSHVYNKSAYLPPIQCISLL